MTAPKSLTPHSATLDATLIFRGPCRYSVTAERLDGAGALPLYRAVQRSALEQYATTHGYTIHYNGKEG